MQSTSVLEPGPESAAPTANDGLAAGPPVASSPRFVDRFAVASSRRVLVVPTDEVDWIEAEGNYVRIHRNGASHLLRETMKRLELALDPAAFARIHRSAFVRLDRVREIVRLASGALHLNLASGDCVALSRNYRHSFLRALFPGVETSELERVGDVESGEPSLDPTP